MYASHYDTLFRIKKIILYVQKSKTKSSPVYINFYNDLSIVYSRSKLYFQMLQAWAMYE